MNLYFILFFFSITVQNSE